MSTQKFKIVPVEGFFTRTLRKLGVGAGPLWGTRNLASDMGFPKGADTSLFGFGKYASTTIQNQNVAVGASISVTKDLYSSLPIVICDRNDPAEKIPVADSELQWLANPGMESLLEFQESISFWLDVCGEFFALAERSSPFNPPRKLEMLAPFAMTDIVKGGKLYWRYDDPFTGGRARDFPAWQILHIKNYGYQGPYSLLGVQESQSRKVSIRGVPPLLPVMESVAADIALTQYLKDNLNYPLVLSGIIKSSKGSKMKPEDREKILMGIQNQISGWNHRRRVLIASNDIDFQENKFSPFDVQAKELKEITEREVFMIFGTNPVILGIFSDVKSYEGSKEAQKLFWRRKLIPRSTRVLDSINQQFLQFMYSGQYTVEHDFSKIEALDDMDQRIARAKESLMLGYTPNQVNERFDLGFPEIEDEYGDLPLPMFRQSALPPVLEDEPPDDGEEPPEDGNEPPEDGEEPPEDGSEANRFLRKKKRILNGIQRDFDNAESQAHGGIRRIMMSIRAEALKNFKELYGNGYPKHQDLVVESPLFNTQKRIDEFNRYLGARYEQSFWMAQGQITVEVPNAISGNWDMAEKAQHYARTREIITVSLVTHIDRDLRAIVSDGILTGKGPPEIARNIRKNFNTTLRRARTIARTETATAINTARYNLIVDEPAVRRHEWNSSLINVRPSHQIDGEIRFIGVPFSNGLLHPGDPSGPAEEVINCRCVGLAVVEEEIELWLNQRQAA